MKRSFDNIIMRFQRLPNMKFKVTMKNGSTLDIVNFHIKGDVVLDKSGKHASVSEIDYIEINSD